MMEEVVKYYPYGRTSSTDQIRKFKNYTISNKDKKILKELAKRKSEIAELPIHKDKIKMWKDLI